MVEVTHGIPAPALTDNGNVYTTKYAGGARGRGTANAFELGTFCDCCNQQRSYRALNWQPRHWFTR